MIWKQKPVENWLALKVKDYSEISALETPNLFLMKKELGEGATVDVLTLLILDAIKYFNVGKAMNADQVKMTAELVAEEFNEVTIADLKLCFNKAKKGEYGILYDRIDGAIVIGWINQYCDNKIGWAVNRSLNAHHHVKDFDSHKRSEQIQSINKKIGDIRNSNNLNNAQQIIDEAKKDVGK